MSPKPAPFRNDSMTLLKSGAAIGVLGASFIDGSAAEAGNKAQKEQAEALKAAAATRAAASQPAAEASDDNYARAKMLLGAGDVPGAMASFRRVLAEEPRSVDAMNGLGVTYDRMGRHDVARGWYEAALAVSPDDGAVLTNLGYSLTLQNEWREAIPWLQAATRSGDAAAVQTARRLLAQASAALTAERARAPVFARPAELALSVPAPGAAPLSAQRVLQTRLAQAPAAIVTGSLASAPKVSSAHIELAANGEAQLVLGNGRAPAAELVASLGDAATLVLAPPATVHVADAPAKPILAEARTASRAVGRRADAAVQHSLVVVEAPVAVLVLANAPEIALVPALVEARRRSDALAGAVELASNVAPAERVVAAVRPAIVREAVARIAAASKADDKPSSAPVDIMLFALAPAALTQTSVAAAPVLRADIPFVDAGGASMQGADGSDIDPAWLLHVRRIGFDGRSAPAAPSLALTTLEKLGSRRFDSDDGALNQFAARLRGPVVPADEDGLLAARQAAIARLEAVIARVRAA